jgi:predicted DNA binding protein
MWIAKISGVDKNNPIYGLAKRTRVTIQYYPINHYIKGKSYFFTSIGIVQGTDKKIHQFFKEYKKLLKVKSNKSRKLTHLEINKNFFVAVTSETASSELDKYIHLYYNPELIHIKPAIIYPTFIEDMEIACIDRKVLESIIKSTIKRYNGKLLYIRKSKLTDIGVFNILPKITSFQKQALYLAIDNHYYGYPRKIELEALAKRMNISLSTYRAHLRKAENKVLSTITKKS